MDVKDIEYALSVIKNRSFTVAAEELHLSQPALSKYFSNLERNLGLRLVDRTSKGLVPTYAGERFYAHAAEIAKSMQALNTEMKRVAAIQKNRLRVGMIRNFHQQFLARTIERFSLLHPAIELNITQQLSKDIENDVVKGKLDIGFIAEPSIPGSIDYRPLASNFTLLAVPSSMGLCAHSLNKEGLPFPWIDVALLRDARFVLQDESCRFRKFIEEFFESENFTPLIGMTTQSTVDALRFTELGVGPCFITDGYLCYITEHSHVDIFCVGAPAATTKLGVIAQNLGALTLYAEDFIKIYMSSNVSVPQQKPTR